MKKTLAAFILLFAMYAVARADHHVAMDLTYRYTGNPDQYELTLTFYRDCDGMSMPNTVDVCFRSVTCNFLGSVTLNKISGPTLVPWPTCVVRPAGAGGCNGGSVYDIQKAVFRGTLYLPYMCPDWQFEYVNCCRNYDITTINPAGTENIYLDARIDNLNHPVNSSPVFNTLPASIWCLNKEQIFDPGTVETDGDSLVYELVTPRSLGNMVICDPANPAPYPVTYVGGYSAQNFMGSVSGIQFDPATGVIKFTPNLLQVSVVDLKVREYRNGVLIGSVIRSLQFFITPQCQSSVPAFVTGTVNGVGDAISATCGDPSVTLTLDKNILCNTVASDGSDFLVTDAGGNPIPVLGAAPHSCQPPFDNQVVVYLGAPLTAGVSKIWSKNGTDANTLVSACNDQLPVNDTVNVVVAPCISVVAALSASDTSFCERTCVTFYDYSTNNPTSWSWWFPGAIPDTSSQQNPSNICYLNFGDFDVQLVACNGSGCDTVWMPAYVKVHPSLQVPQVTVSGDTLTCEPSVFYQWFMNGTLLQGATGQSLVVSQPGSYYVLISDSNGCEVTSDAIVVTGLATPGVLAGITSSPVPFVRSVTFTGSLAQASEMMLLVSDVHGREVHRTTAQYPAGTFTLSMDASGWSPGVYWVRFVAGDRTVARKVIRGSE